MVFRTLLNIIERNFFMRWNFQLFSFNFNSKMKDLKFIIIGQFSDEEFIFF